MADQAYSQSSGVLVVSQASDPVDIIWSNMGGARGLYLLRVVLLNLIVLYIILFLSTPAAIYSSLTLSQLFDHLEVTGLVNSLLPPLVIIFINTCLLYLLDFFASWEKRVAHSKYQQSTFTKAFVYLALNMLLIPAATLTVQTTVVAVLKESSMLEALARFYSGEHLQSQGVFFISLIVQNACLSVCLNLLRPGEFVAAFFSPWLAHYRRKYMNDSQPWRRKEGFVFLYGYYAALQLVIFSIVIVYSCFIPLVAVAGLLFFLLRHATDGFCLLTVNRKEIDSSGRLPLKIIHTCQLPVLLLQMCMMATTASEGHIPIASFLGVLFIASAAITVWNFRRPVPVQVESNGQDKRHWSGGEDDGTTSVSSPVSFAQWRSEYNHPLAIVGHSSSE